MEANRSRPSPGTATGASVLKVLDDGDLLREILLRLDFSTFLVRGALVCKRWLRHVSDPDFLRRFQERHPPRLLGFYIESASVALPQFVPLPRLPPALAAVVRPASFDLRTAEWYWNTSIYHCRNGRLLLRHTSYDKTVYQVRSPINPARDGTVVATGRTPCEDEGDDYGYMLLPDDGDDGLSVNLVSVQRKVYAKVRFFQGGVCNDLRTSASIELPENWNRSLNRSLLHDGKLYVLGTTGYILGLELLSTTLFFIEFPDDLRYECPERIQLSISSHQAGNSGLYLINVKDFAIQIWLHSAEGNSTGTWVLVDTICLRQAFGHLAKPSWESEDSRISLAGSGDNAEFVFLEVQAEIFCMYIKSRRVEKVYEMEFKDDFVFQVYPFMMVWPPIFPAKLIKRHDQEEISKSLPLCAQHNEE